MNCLVNPVVVVLAASSVVLCFVLFRPSAEKLRVKKNCISALCHRESHSSGGFYLLKRSEISRFVSPPMISGVS